MSKYETKILTTPYGKPDAYHALAMPVYYTAAYEFDSAEGMEAAFCGRSAEHAYSRISNPTVQYLERRVQATTGAASVTALNSGMAAISYVLTAITKTGCNIVTSRHLFGNTLSYMTDTLGGYGVQTRLADLTNPAATETAIDNNTCAIFLEIITNPQMEVADLQALSDMAHRHHVPLIADTTIVPFTAFHAKDFGVDIEVLSSTKYISGGATGLGGLILDYGSFDWRISTCLPDALQRRADKLGKLAFTARIKTELISNMGAMMTPQVAYMETLGLETLDLRYRQQASSALWLAQQLQEITEIKQVTYTGLSGNAYYGLSQKQFGNLPGAMLTIDMTGKEDCYRLMNRLKTIRRATNLFDHKSLAIHPASTIFGNYSDTQRKEMDVKDSTIRLSIGLEDPKDLLDDLKQAIMR